MICKYRARGVFNIFTSDAKKAFESVKSEFEGKLSYQVVLTICDVNQHIKVTERIIRFVKE